MEILGHIPEDANEWQMASHTCTFHSNLTPEVRADEVMQKMCDGEVMGISDQNKSLTPNAKGSRGKTLH